MSITIPTEIGSIWTNYSAAPARDTVRIWASDHMYVAFDIIEGRNGPTSSEREQESPPRCRRLWGRNAFLNGFKPYVPDEIVVTPIYGSGPTWLGGSYPSLETAKEATIEVRTPPFAYLKVNRTQRTAEVVS